MYKLRISIYSQNFFGQIRHQIPNKTGDSSTPVDLVWGASAIYF